MFINLKEVAMPFLSSSAGEIKEHYTVLVIGSGYGGASPPRGWRGRGNRSAFWSAGGSIKVASTRTRNRKR